MAGDGGGGRGSLCKYSTAQRKSTGRAGNVLTHMYPIDLLGGLPGFCQTLTHIDRRQKENHRKHV